MGAVNVRRSLFLMAGVRLIMRVAVHLLDIRRNPRPTATVIVQLTASDSKTVAELALHNLVGDMPKAPKRSEEVLSQASDLASEGKDAIQSDLAQAVIDAVPAIDNFVEVMDNITDVRTFNL